MTNSHSCLLYEAMLKGQLQQTQRKEREELIWCYVFDNGLELIYD